MTSFQVGRFLALLKKEFLENRSLIVGAPAVLALSLFVLNFLIVSQLGPERIILGLEFLNRWFDGQSPIETAPIISLLAFPFGIIFFFCSVIYLLNALYQDRRDMSILFWQSMPVSNLQTVLSKIVTVMVVSPAFLVACMSALYFLLIISLTFLGLRNEVEVAGFGYLLAAVFINLVIFYLFIATSVLWLLPLVGWLLLFSAFARKAPMLWAIGVYFLLGFLEEFVFGSQFLSNWAQTRFDPDNFIIIEFIGLADRFLSYDMFIGIVVGTILISGAVYMRSFVD
ncbi:MAG: ABC-2 type transport system permease protein [Pseudohongiellaceae bacterium]|jgi:ABC-2 type transport system permease protein